MPDEVIRQYTVLPAVEQVKILIVERLKILFDYINILFQNKLQSKKDDEVIAIVKSTTISIYLLLKPKIMEYMQQKTKFGGNDTMLAELSKMIGRIEASISNPNNMTIEDALYYADIINIFCHDYGITKITYFAGTVTQAEKDIYKV